VSHARPVRLNPRAVERPWGVEIWFTSELDLPLLVKFITAREKMSVQVHPDDAYAAKRHNQRGKTEMWYIASARPDARLALGLNQSVDRERLREMALTGEIERALNWIQPQPGDMFLGLAGTIHAIGGGVELWEVQENSDITYRFYDYGRGRQLHLDDALNVANLAQTDPVPARDRVACSHFIVEHREVRDSFECTPNGNGFELLIFVSGAGQIAGQPFTGGEVWLVPAGAAPFTVAPTRPCDLLLARQP